MKRVNNLFEKLISDDNLSFAIDEVNRSHHWHRGHRPNKCTAWVELTKPDRIEELRQIILKGFEPAEPRVTKRYDSNAKKYRKVQEPKQWPDQYVHHALIQVLQPVMLRGMDYYCCGSIPGRGQKRAMTALKSWMKNDPKGTKYGLSCDIRHFYDSLSPSVVLSRMSHLIKDKQTLDLISRVTAPGIFIGYYTSQWFANTVLQPLDMLIRQSGLCKHYVRYMDNFTIMGANKRNLHKLKNLIGDWLLSNGLRLKDDWQIYRIEKRGVYKRLPDAVGYRYGRGFTLPRKRNLLKIKRGAAKVRKAMAGKGKITPKRARGLLSIFAQLKHCTNYQLYKLILQGKPIVKYLKHIVSQDSKRKEWLEWNTYLGIMETMRLSRQRAILIPI